MDNPNASFLERLEKSGYFSIYANAKSCLASSDWHSTAIFALRYTGGVFVCADRRATNRNLEKQDDVLKIFPLGKTAVFAISGALSLGLSVANLLGIEVRDFNRKNSREMSTEGKAKRASRILDQYLPMMMSDPSHSLILSGILVGSDEDVGKVFIYRIFPFSPLEYENYVAEGSGGPNALDVIRDRWRNNLDRQEALKLTIRALRLAYDANAGVGGKEPTIYDVTPGNLNLVASREIRELANMENGG